MQAIMPQEKPGLWASLWQAIRELNFVTAFFGWLFMAASRLSEPMMSISAIYIILAAGIPSWNIPMLYETSVAVMIAAPEIIMPGSFVLASQASQREDSKAWLLHLISWMFVLLTLFTLADLFIFHLDSSAHNILMWARCAIGIGYSVLLRILTHDQPGHQAQPTQAPAAPAPLDYEEIARRLRGMFPQPAPAPQIDYQAIASAITPIMPAPQVDYQTIAGHIAPMLEATFRATIVREIKATVAPLTISEPAAPQIEARASSATGERRQREHYSYSEPAAPGATGDQEERLETAYQQLVQQGARISGRALAPLARVHRTTATKWLELRVTYGSQSQYGDEYQEPEEVSATNQERQEE